MTVLITVNFYLASINFDLSHLRTFHLYETEFRQEPTITEGVWFFV